MYGVSTIVAMNNKSHEQATTLWKSRHTGRYYYPATDAWFDTIGEATAILRITFTTLRYLGSGDTIPNESE
jgi:hypothetical protein